MKRKTVSQYREQKLERMRKMLSLINKQPRTSNELQKILNLSRQTANNYELELVGLKLIEKSEDGRYHPVGSEKKEYRSKADYEVALEHSKKLIEGTIYRENDPLRIIDFLAFDDPDNPSEGLSDFIKFFEQHLKTGYPEVWVDLKKYRETAHKVGYLDNSGFPKVWTFEGHEKKFPEEFVTLQKKLIGEVGFIFTGVRHGVVLKGYCDVCPDQELTIKG